MLFTAGESCVVVKLYVFSNCFSTSKQLLRYENDRNRDFLVHTLIIKTKIGYKALNSIEYYVCRTETLGRGVITLSLASTGQ